MNKIFNYFQNQKGATIIETLVALGFIGVVSTGFLTIAIESRKISFRNKVQYELGRYAGIIAEEVVKDYTLGNPIEQIKYCQTGSTAVGNLVSNYLNDFSTSTCSVTSVVQGNYNVELTTVAFGVILTSEREIILR